MALTWIIDLKDGFSQSRFGLGLWILSLGASIIEVSKPFIGSNDKNRPHWSTSEHPLQLLELGLYNELLGTLGRQLMVRFANPPV